MRSHVTNDIIILEIPWGAHGKADQLLRRSEWLK